MTNYHLSKSRFCSGVQCPKILWLRKNMPQEEDDSFEEGQFVIGHEVGNTAKPLFGSYIEVPFSESLSDMIDSTKDLIEKGEENICEASFSSKGCFCIVDILRNHGNKELEIYEVKSSTSVKWIYEYDVAYQYYVLTNLGYTVKKACLVHIDHSYVRHGDLELNKLFAIKDLTDTAKDKQPEIEDLIISLKEYALQIEEPQMEIGSHCTDPYECEYWDYCAGDLQDQGPTVFDVSRLQSKKKQELYDKGIITFEQLFNAQVLSGSQFMQVDHELHNKPPHINVKEIHAFMKTLSYPLYFLDFESFQPPIPLFDNSCPYEQIVFQYSLHYINEKDGPLFHKDFLACPGEDPRRNLAEQLCKDIPFNVCTTAYNMGFEKGRIKTLADFYPDFSEHLMNIHDNIKDLMLPFQKKWYYRKEFQGSYSIKYVLPALFPDDKDLNYANLEDVHNGMEASYSFLAMQKMKSSEVERWRSALLKYCFLDTLAMVKIWEKLREVSEL